MRNTLGMAKNGGLVKRALVALGVALLCAALAYTAFVFLSYRAVMKSIEPPGTVHVGGGAVITSKSGLTLKVPLGARATITPSDGHSVAEIVSVEFPDDHWSASVISYSAGSPSRLNRSRYRTLASSEQSRVVVLETTYTSLPVVVETNLPGALRGRVIPMLQPSSKMTARGLSLAQLVWRRLDITGASLP